MAKRKTYSILIALIFLLAGCGRITNNTEEITNNQIVATESQVSEDLDMIATSDARTTETQLSTIPDYSGSPSVEVDGNIPNFTDEDKALRTLFLQRKYMPGTAADKRTRRNRICQTEWLESGEI